MKLRFDYKIRLLLTLLVITLLAGCGRKASIAPEQKVIWQDDLYETLWVEPQIILADSLMTLIRSNRIDSVLADQTITARPGRASIEIRIYESACNVSVGLRDSEFRLVRPLLVRYLTRGFYQLTVNMDRFDRLMLPPGEYNLRVDYCDQVQMTAVAVE
jgi:hypothetical protein